MSNVTGRNLLLRVADMVGNDLELAERQFQEELQSWHPYVTDVVTHVARFRGKRLRPILVLLSAKACGGIRDDHHVLAAVVEMIHAATLVHDDILDEADTRRHVATVNSRWNNETSVLCGDYLFTHAFHLAATLDAHACRLIGRATNLVCEGELCQVHERANSNLTQEQYYRIINGKTAALCALCSYVGAHYAGATSEVSEAFQEYGRLLGMAFQIADDVLDLVGDQDNTGKSIGTDYEKQKLTLPLIHLLQTAPASVAAKARELIENPGPENRAALLQIVKSSDAIDYAANTAREFADKAIVQLGCVPESPARQILAEMADFACQRSF
ncbi:MAG: polyprenyl synthetase family protein [Planctomycetaceae bacterium]